MKSLVLPFYKQNAGLFAFLIFFMVAAVGRANDVGLLEYHLSFLRGMMTNFPFLLFTLCAWILYALKCARFIIDTLGKKNYGFISLLSLKNPMEVYWMLLLVQIVLLIPVLLYAFIAIWIGLLHHWWQHVIIILVFFFFLIICGALKYQYLLNHPDKRRSADFWKTVSFSNYSFYWLFLFRYLLTTRKVLFLVIKISSCVILYGLLFGQSGDAAALRMVILFYSFGLLGHGVLIYTIREMEENNLAFFRGLPVSLFQRFLQYLPFYFILFIPEIMVIEWLTPDHVSLTEAILLVFFGYSVLLFLNSLLFIQFFKKTDYLKIVTGLYLFIFIAVLAGLFPAFCIGLFLLSIYLFSQYYYRFEKK